MYEIDQILKNHEIFCKTILTIIVNEEIGIKFKVDLYSFIFKVTYNN